MSWVEVVRDNLKMEQVLERYIGSSDRMKKWLCPFHSDKHPSMSINPKTDRFMCFACGARGDLIDFVQHFFNLQTQREALEVLDRDFNLGLKNNREEAEIVRQARLKRERERKEKEELEARVKAWMPRVRLLRRIMEEGEWRLEPKKGEPMEGFIADDKRVCRCQWFWYQSRWLRWIEDSIDEFPYEFNLQDCCFHFDATVLGESPTLFVQGGEKADFERRKKTVLQKLEKGEIELIWQRNRNIMT